MREERGEQFIFEEEPKCMTSTKGEEESFCYFNDPTGELRMHIFLHCLGIADSHEKYMTNCEISV